MFVCITSSCSRLWPWWALWVIRIQLQWRFNLGLRADGFIKEMSNLFLSLFIPSCFQCVFSPSLTFVSGEETIIIRNSYQKYEAYVQFILYIEKSIIISMNGYAKYCSAKKKIYIFGHLSHNSKCLNVIALDDNNIKMSDIYFNGTLHKQNTSFVGL